MTDPNIEAIWRAVVALLADEGLGAHEGCEADPPDECTLYKTIKEAALVKE